MSALKEIEEAGMRTDLNALNGLLYALAAHGHIDAMRAVIAARLHEWPEAHRDEPFGILARYFIQNGQPEKAEAMVEEVEKRGIPIGAGIANPLLAFYADKVYHKNFGAGVQASAQVNTTKVSIINIKKYIKILLYKKVSAPI